MPWKPTSDMTRDELVQQLEPLREIVERLAAKIMPIPDDDRTLHEVSREELLGQVMRLREELDQRDAPQPASGREMHKRLARSGPPMEITLEQMLWPSRKG